TKKCYPKIATLAKDMDVSRRTVERSLGQLETMGCITVERRVENNAKISSVYTVITNPTKWTLPMRHKCRTVTAKMFPRVTSELPQASDTNVADPATKMTHRTISNELDSFELDSSELDSGNYDAAQHSAQIEANEAEVKKVSVISAPIKSEMSNT